MNLNEEFEGYRVLIENTKTQIAILYDPETYAIVNGAHAEFLGKNKCDMEGKTAWEIFNKMEAEYCIETNKKVFEGKKELIGKQWVSNGKGEARLLQIAKTPILDKENHVRFVIIKGDDITLESRLRLSEQQYSAIVENQTELICKFLPSGELTFVNKAYCDYYNKTYEELIGGNFLTSAPQKYHKLITDKLSSINSKNPMAMYEYKMANSKGTVFWQKWTSYGFFDDRGKVIEFQAVGSDITYFKETEENLKNNYSKIEIEVSKRTRELEEANLKLKNEILERERIEEKLSENISNLKQSLNSSINVILKMLAIRDPYTVNHQERVAYIAYNIGRELQLNRTALKAIYIGALLHDVGKIYIPPDFLNKPGKLSEIEFSIMKTHPTVGYNILSEIKFPWAIDQIALQHHERINGTGYPLGLKGEDILLESRIVAVSDVVEAMSSHRPYREALGIDAALDEIKKYRGIHFDPDVVDACLRLFSDKNFNFVNEKLNLGELLD